MENCQEKVKEINSPSEIGKTPIKQVTINVIIIHILKNLIYIVLLDIIIGC